MATEYTRYGSNHRYDNRRVGIVSGRAFSSTQIHANRNSASPPVFTNFQAQVANRGGSAAVERTTGAAKPRGFKDPEMKRKKRIAKYKVYTVEGKVKDCFKNGFRWIKLKCSKLVHGC